MIDVSISLHCVSNNNLQCYYFHKHHYHIQAYYVLTQDYWESWSAFDEMRSHFRGSCLLFACSQKNSLIVFCPICELLLTSIHLLHFLCQFPKLKKYHVEIFSAPSHFQRRLTASPWQLPISKDGRACRPCVWREALRGAGGAHMEQWPSRKKKKKHSARLYVPAVPILIPPLPSSALWWRRSAAITASDCCWARARLHLTKPGPVCFCKTMSPRVVDPPSLDHLA